MADLKAWSDGVRKANCQLCRVTDELFIKMNKLMFKAECEKSGTPRRHAKAFGTVLANISYKS